MSKFVDCECDQAFLLPPDLVDTANPPNRAIGRQRSGNDYNGGPTWV